MQEPSLSHAAVDGCRYDEQVPPDAQGRYTIVVFAPASRLADARAECGVALPVTDFKQRVF